MTRFAGNIKISLFSLLLVALLGFFPSSAVAEESIQKTHDSSQTSSGIYAPVEAHVVGYYTEEEGHLPSSFSSFTENMENMTILAPFWFRLNQYDCTDIESTDGFDETEAHNLVTIAHDNNVCVLPVIHNFLYDDKSLTQDLVTEMLSSPVSRNNCISNIVNLIKYYNFDGVNMDFEGIRQSDKDNLSLFYSELGDRLRTEGYTFSVAIPAKENDSHNPWATPYDYDSIGEAADLVMLMMYNEHGFPGSGSGPVSSIGFNNSVIDYAVDRIAPHKIILAEPVFGFDFNLQTGRYTYLSHEMAMERLENYDARVHFDLTSLTPFFSYTDALEQGHEVWYEDKLSLLHKLDLISRHSLGGLAMWRLGMEDPEAWQAIQEKVIFKHNPGKETTEKTGEPPEEQ
ncbi:MAG TPA: glycosyl hydrolase family 18 protein [Clostridia bacterium]|nr:glycosyl hydrolase family 18 protein [Clostridia bacterium]